MADDVKFNPSESLLEAHEKLWAVRDDGVTCPCCRQLAKRYGRKMNHIRAAALCWMTRVYEAERRWINVPNEAPRAILKGGGEYAKLSFWGLAARMPKDETSRKGAKTSGMWVPTLKGIEFAHDRIVVPRFAYVYDDKLEGFSDETTDIRASLGDWFDYYELMGFPAPSDTATTDQPRLF